MSYDEGTDASSDALPGEEPLVRVRNLKKHYPITKGVLKKELGRVRAVDGVSFEIYPGETLGLVGESGCGKSTAATTMLRLEEPTDGDVIFDGRDITRYNQRELKRFRRRAQMIFQDPTSSFDPRMSIGESVAEPLRIHGMANRERRRAIVKDLLERVGMAADDIDRYPHEFSGGQKQRVALARALSVSPELIVADEPASALDVSIQAEILRLLSELQEEFGLAILFISHDLGVIRDICDRVAVMYLGEIVETGETEELFENPQHPYTRALLSSIPSADPRQRGLSMDLSGDVPNPSNPPVGCRFHTRCPEIIQPEGYDFDQENWRSVMDLRIKLQQGRLDLESLGELVIAETGDETETLQDVTDEQLRAAIRRDYGLPEELEDPEAEEVLQRAIDAVVGGLGETMEGRFDSEVGEAARILREEFKTVCELENPTLVETDAGHPAACHLHDQSVDAEASEFAVQNAESDD